MKMRKRGEAMDDKWYTYITQNGDTWDQIAYKALKDSSLIHFLYNWNEEYSNYFIFPAGIKIKYKLIKKANTNIPPWRQ